MSDAIETMHAQLVTLIGERDEARRAVAYEGQLRADQFQEMHADLMQLRGSLIVLRNERDAARREMCEARDVLRREAANLRVTDQSRTLIADRLLSAAGA